MQLARRFRIPAVLCALAVLFCELLAKPFANMGVMDDGAYVPIARALAATGHIAYTGWATPMLGLQLYLGAAFIKLFGFSFSAVRMSTLLVAVAMAFVFQRTLVRVGITERNAAFGTLALVLSPLYLMLSVTYMSDIHGLFGIVLCLYGCLRSMQSVTDRTSIAWLFFAVITNAAFGTSRQIAWLGILLIVPSTLWLLRGRRRVLIAGAVLDIAGALFIFLCLHWLKHQPYSIPEDLALAAISPTHVLGQLTYFFLDALFPLLPVLALFLPWLRKTRLSIVLPLSALVAVYLCLALYPSHLRGHFLLLPIGECIGNSGTYAYPLLHETPPTFLPLGLQALFTLIPLAGLLGLITLMQRPIRAAAVNSGATPSWHQLCMLFVPFSIAYSFLISQRGETLEFHDRYVLGLLVIAIPCLVRYYQEHAPRTLPLAGFSFFP